MGILCSDIILIFKAYEPNMTPLLKRYLEVNRSTIKNLWISLPRVSSSFDSYSPILLIPLFFQLYERQLITISLTHPNSVPKYRGYVDEPRITRRHIRDLPQIFHPAVLCIQNLRARYTLSRTDMHFHDHGREKHVHFHGDPRLGRLADPHAHGVRCHRSSKKR